MWILSDNMQTVGDYVLLKSVFVAELLLELKFCVSAFTCH